MSTRTSLFTVAVLAAGFFAAAPWAQGAEDGTAEEREKRAAKERGDEPPRGPREKAMDGHDWKTHFEKAGKEEDGFSLSLSVSGGPLDSGQNHFVFLGLKNSKDEARSLAGSRACGGLARCETVFFRISVAGEEDLRFANSFKDNESVHPHPDLAVAGKGDLRAVLDLDDIRHSDGAFNLLIEKGKPFNLTVEIEGAGFKLASNTVEVKVRKAKDPKEAMDGHDWKTHFEKAGKEEDGFSLSLSAADGPFERGQKHFLFLGLKNGKDEARSLAGGRACGGLDRCEKLFFRISVAGEEDLRFANSFEDVTSVHPHPDLAVAGKGDLRAVLDLDEIRHHGEAFDLLIEKGKPFNLTVEIEEAGFNLVSNTVEVEVRKAKDPPKGKKPPAPKKGPPLDPVLEKERRSKLEELEKLRRLPPPSTP